MSELRRQIEDAKQQYLTGAYPGRLTDDVMETRRRVLVLRRVAAGLALAAMVLLAWCVWPSSDVAPQLASRATTRSVRLATDTPAAAEADATSRTFSLTNIEVPNLASLGGVSMVPSFSSIIVSNAPAITDVSRDEQNTSTTKETSL